jgi:predicted phage terminase large subunit-like protein
MPQGKIVMTLTRWHEDDVAGRAIKMAHEDPKADQWRVLVLPATNDNGDEAYIYDTRTKRKQFLKRYEALWPETYPREDLDKIRATISPRWWNALYQQRPTAMEGGIIKKAWIERYDEKKLPNVWDQLTQSWDMAFKDNKNSSYVAGQVWGRWRTRYYLLHQWRDHAGFAKSCEAIKEVTAAWPAARIKLVEDKANGPAIIETLSKEVGGFIAIEPIGSKPARLEACSPLYQSHSVLHPTPQYAPWINSVEEELLTAPNNTYWDQADCVSQYLNWDRMKAVGPIDHLPSQVRQVHTYLRGY